MVLVDLPPVEDALAHNAVGETAEDSTRECAKMTLLEQGFPARELSLVIAADRRVVDPVYGVHRWWARRPRALMRGILLASVMDESVSQEEFWGAYLEDAPHLAGLRIHDPFVGGGSTLVEAVRLGADATGSDVDPLAVRIVQYELDPAPSEAVLKAGASLLLGIKELNSLFYPAIDGSEPLHFFYISIVTCPHCGEMGPLYRSLVLVRDAGKSGAVVRDHAITAFCPIDFQLHHIDDLSAESFSCCGKVHSLSSGNYAGQAYHCPTCNGKASHRELRTGVAPRRLVAIEETGNGHRRRLRTPTAADQHAIKAASAEWDRLRTILPYPNVSLSEGRRDGRPHSYGITTADQLFTPRQLLTLSRAFDWIRHADLPGGVQRALELAISNALATNNRLCGYATDYGRLSPLFMVRGYSLPTLSVELNPLHATGGRGTFNACIRRVAEADTPSVRRWVWSSENAPVSRSFTSHVGRPYAEVRCEDASTLPDRGEHGTVDVCVFDPPYFDYIAYDELSEFHRAWFEGHALGGDPLYPEGDDYVASFGNRLGACLQAAVLRMKLHRPLAFTYHSTNPQAWEAIGLALDAAHLSVTAIWPVRSDGHMGHHSYDGNCEWDLVIVCRRTMETVSQSMIFTVDQWVKTLTPLEVSAADQRSMELALAMASTRYATIRRDSDETCS